MEVERPNSWFEPDDYEPKTYEIVKTIVYEIEAGSKDEALKISKDKDEPYIIHDTEIYEL